MMPDCFRIKFTMVSEPAADQEADCEDIGVAYVSIPEILRTESDVREQNYDRKCPPPLVHIAYI